MSVTVVTSLREVCWFRSQITCQSRLSIAVLGISMPSGESISRRTARILGSPGRSTEIAAPAEVCWPSLQIFCEPSFRVAAIQIKVRNGKCITGRTTAVQGGPTWRAIITGNEGAIVSWQGGFSATVVLVEVPFELQIAYKTCSIGSSPILRTRLLRGII